MATSTEDVALLTSTHDLDTAVSTITAFVNEHEQNLLFTCTEEQAMKVFAYGMEIISDGEWSDDHLVKLLTAMKVFTRARIGASLLRTVESLSKLLDLTQSHLHPDLVSEISNQALRIIINIAFSDQPVVLPLLVEISAHTRALEMIQTAKHPIMRFALCRILLYTCLDKKPLASIHEEVFPILIPIFHELTAPGFQEDADITLAACEVLKVLFLFHADYPYSGDKSLMHQRIAEIMSISLLCTTTVDSEDHYNVSSFPIELQRVFNVKVDLSNLMWTERDVPPPSVSENPLVLGGFMELCEIQSRVDKARLEGALAPLLFVMKGLALTNLTARRCFKGYLFGKYAVATPSDPDTEVDPKATMHPVGKSDDVEGTLKPTLIKLITSFKMTLKTAASEFFFALAGNQCMRHFCFCI